MKTAKVGYIATTSRLEPNPAMKVPVSERSSNTNISSHRVHVDRPIGDIKCFKILDGVIPLSQGLLESKDVRESISERSSRGQLKFTTNCTDRLVFKVCNLVDIK